MNRMRFSLVLLFSVAWLVLAGPRGLAAQPVPLGPEIEFFTDVFPSRPLLAVHPGGASVIVWDELGDVVYHYMAPGRKPVNGWQSELRILEGGPQADAVTATPNGFDVIWHVSDDDNAPVFYRRHLNLRGVPEGRPVRLGRGGTDWVWQVRGNGFMAGWALPNVHGIAARHLSSSGRPTGPELRLNSRPVDGPINPVLLAVADGGFVAAWLGTLPGTTAGSSSTLVLRVRRFSPAGTPLGPDFDVNTTPLRADWERGPYVDPDFQVAAAPDGGFAVAWAYDDAVYLRFFDAAGQALGPEIQAATAEKPYRASSIAFDKTGNLLLLWGDESDAGLQLRLFDPQGVPLGPPAGVRSRASNIYIAPFDGRVAWAGDSWIVTWIAAGAPQFDFDTLFMRRFK